MPYSSTQTLVGNNDTIQVRYPTPSTWNTSTSITLYLGTGSDTFTLGTKIPIAKVQAFSFTDQTGRTVASSSTTTTTFEKATFYYSNSIVATGSGGALDIQVPVAISCTTLGPKGSTTGTNASAAFQVNNSGNWVTSANIGEGDTIQLRVKTENWYTTTSNVTLTIGNETWGTSIGQASNVVSDTWTITTRAQDLAIPAYSFTDYIDVKYSEFNLYKTKDITITSIDSDAVLRAVSTGDIEISKNGTTWSQSLTTGTNRLVSGDTLYTRIKIKNGYTLKSTGTLSVYSVSGDTATINSVNYENNITYNTGAVTQAQAAVDDNWQVWTEVDRYPDAVALAPIYTVSDGDEVTVSSTTTYSYAEVDRYYYADFAISGLGNEYVTGSYSDLESPLNPALDSGTISSLKTLANTLNGADVEILCKITQGPGTAEIRKNNTGSWVQQLFVKDGDEVNFRIKSSTSYNTTITATVKLSGPPAGGSLGNPTGGPSTPSFADKETTISLKTRSARTTPYPFRIVSVYNAEPGQTYTAQVPLLGLDQSTTAQITAQSSGVTAQLSGDGQSFSSTAITVDSNRNFSDPDYQPNYLYVRGVASSTGGSLRSITYKVGDYTDTFYIFTRKAGHLYYFYNASNPVQETFTLPSYANIFDVVVAGAGGGNGGDDAPNSYGGRGGFGNLIRASVNIPDSAYSDPENKQLTIYQGGDGKDGTNFSTGAAGGNGGFGYATGGDGGAAGSGDKSGGGGGGGGASAILLGSTPIVIAGGGGGGAGAGNDTEIQKSTQNGNNLDTGTLRTALTGISTTGNDGPSNTSQGGGAGGGGGGWGTAGTISTSRTDENGVVVQTTDLDATGGNGGGSYYNTSYVTLETPPSTVGSQLGWGGSTNTPGFIVISHAPQDITPDGFSFTSVPDAEPLTTITSNLVSITGITGKVSAVASEYDAQIRVCDSNGANCGAWSSTSVFVRNNEKIQVRATTTSTYYALQRVKVIVGTSTVYWNITNGAPPDTLPDAFSIPAKKDQEISTAVESDLITITGINTDVEISASNSAQIAICTDGICDSYSASPRNISNGQGFKIKLTSSSSYDTNVSTDVTVGSAAAVTWNVRTKKESDTTPISFFFNDLSGQALNTEVFSTTTTIQGIDTVINFSVTNGATIIKNDVDLGVSTTTVQLFDTVQLKYVTSQIVGDEKSFAVTAGTYTTTWTVSNAGSLGTNPTPFSFSTKTATAALTPTESDSVTIAGLGVSQVSVYATNGALLSINGGAYNSYTFANPGVISNGQTLKVKLTSNELAGFGVTTKVYVGAYNTTFTVTTPIGQVDPVKGKWYSDSTKKDGMPVGTILPVFKDATQDDNWGNLNGKLDSRFHGFIYCDGAYVDIKNYPALYNVIGQTYGSKISSKTGTATANSNQITVTNTSNLYPGYTVYTSTGSAVTIPGGTVITSVSGTTVTLSKTITQSGSFTFNVIYQFRLPDMRNRYLMGTGTVDGNASGSPILAPNYSPAKSSTGSKDGYTAGSVGGYWFVNKIGDPGKEIDQVTDPGVIENAVEVIFNATATTGSNQLTSASTTVNLAVNQTVTTSTTGITIPNGTVINSIVGSTITLSNTITVTSGPKTGAFVAIGDKALPAQESDFFAIAQVSTAGYSEVQESIEFVTDGEVTGDVSLKAQKIYEVPSHTHLLVTGQKDQGATKGLIFWNNKGGHPDSFYDDALDLSGSLGSTDTTFSCSINIWGYALADYRSYSTDTGSTNRGADGDNVPVSGAQEGPGWWDGDISEWTNAPGPSGSGYYGWHDPGFYDHLTIRQTKLTGTGTTEIQQYITYPTNPNGNNNPGKDSEILWIASMDIPEKTATIAGYSPSTKLSHSHYLSLTAVTAPSTNFSYGNETGGGTVISGATEVSNNNSVTVTFDALNLGMEVLPGTFTLNSDKQLIPTPTLSPQTYVPLIKPYVWTKWLIKAF